MNNETKPDISINGGAFNHRLAIMEISSIAPPDLLLIRNEAAYKIRIAINELNTFRNFKKKIIESVIQRRM